jgi:predicted small secreted protein
MEFKKMVKKIILCVILIVLCISLTGCQTVQGVGGDIQWTGKKSAELIGGKKEKARAEEEAEEDRY